MRGARAASHVTRESEVTRRRTAVTLGTGVSTEYNYDNANRLTGLTHKFSGSTMGTLTYTYDGTGNRTAVGGTWSRTGQPAALSSANYNANNQQVTFGGQTLTYDLNGNLTSDGTNTYTWNARNQLVSISGGATASFGYDGVARRDVITAGSSSTYTLFDGLDPVKTQTGSASGSTTQFTLLTGPGIDERHTFTDTNGTVSMVTDALGSTVALVAGAGGVATSYTYEAFGATTVTGTGTTSPYSFMGRDDEGAGLKYYRARYYNPRMQRFISEDPVSFSGGDFNVYAFVNGNPISRIDPTGQAGVVLFGGGLAEAGVGNGIAVQASSGGGMFWGGSAGVNFGGYTSSGGYWGDAQKSEFVVGATAGLGGGVLFTNAKCAQQLLGPFDTWNINIPIVSLQYATDGSIRTGAISFGRSWGFSFSRYRVTTTTASGCRCQ